MECRADDRPATPEDEPMKAKTRSGVVLRCIECGEIGSMTVETGNNMQVTCGSCGEVVDPERAAAQLRADAAMWERFGAWLDLGQKIADE
jgi:transcription elongation factor Elf1